MKKRMIYQLALLIALFILLITASFAWFTSLNNSIDNIVITTGNIQMSTALYQINDFNLDGVADEDDNGNVIKTPISSITISNINPSEEFTYRLDVTNTGNIDGKLSLLLSAFSGQLTDVLFVEVIEPSGFDKVFLNGKTLDVLICDNISLLVTQTKSIIFKIRFATATELTDNGISYNNTLEGLNYYKTKQLNISKLTAKLSQ